MKFLKPVFLFCISLIVSTSYAQMDSQLSKLTVIHNTFSVNCQSGIIPESEIERIVESKKSYLNSLNSGGMTHFHASLFYRCKSKMYYLENLVDKKENYIDSAIYYLNLSISRYKQISNEQEQQYLQMVCRFSEEKSYIRKIINQSGGKYDDKATITSYGLVDLKSIQVHENDTVIELKVRHTSYDKSRSYTPGSYVADLPNFPWPPPTSSASGALPRSFFGSAKKLKDVDNKIVESLQLCGYSDYSYYSIPDGFAIVTRLEQTQESGMPKEMPDRWKTTRSGLTELTLQAYFKALFFGNPGYFRTMVFVVTDQPFNKAQKKVTQEVAMSWLSKGLNSLPEDHKNKRFTSDYKCTVLVYEFEQPESENAAHIILPGNHTVKEHIESSGLWQLLDK